MAEIGIEIVGGGYMDKAYAVVMPAFGAVVNTTPRPGLDMDHLGHFTGFTGQIIIETHDSLRAVETEKPVWPTFLDVLNVNDIHPATNTLPRNRARVDVTDF